MAWADILRGASGRHYFGSTTDQSFPNSLTNVFDGDGPAAFLVSAVAESELLN
jgi:hypothetical protein